MHILQRRIPRRKPVVFVNQSNIVPLPRRRSPHPRDSTRALFPWLTARSNSLHLLLEMPLDILYEIFAHLHPLDVLHLARTSKRLRSVLMVPSAVSVWRSALQSVCGLPPCPWDLQESQYANLVFDAHCHFCLTPRAQNLFWSCRVRCCNSCLHKQFVSESTIEHDFPHVANVGQLGEIFPYIVYPSHNKPERILYYRPSAENLIQDFDELSHEPDTVVEQWRLEKSLDQAQRIQHARMCELWSLRWAFQTPHEYNVAIIFALTGLLALLWRETILGKLVDISSSLV